MNPLVIALLSPVWLILLILALVILILLFGSVKIRIISSPSLSVILYACGIPITLVSEKKKEKKRKKQEPPTPKDCKNPQRKNTMK